MKKIFYWIAVLIFLSQTTKAQTFTVPCTGSYCYPFSSTGDYQIYLALKAIGQAIMTSTTSVTGTVNVQDNNADTLNARLAYIRGLDVMIKNYTKYANGKLDSLINSTATPTVSHDISTAMEASSVSKASAGLFYGFHGTSTSAAVQYIMVFNSASVPANGTAPYFEPWVVLPNSSFSFNTGQFPVYMSTGISWSNSSTAAAKTIGAADCWITLDYK